MFRNHALDSFNPTRKTGSDFVDANESCPKFRNSMLRDIGLRCGNPWFCALECVIIGAQDDVKRESAFSLGRVPGLLKAPFDCSVGESGCIAECPD